MDPPAGAAIGDRVVCEGCDAGEPDAQLNPKKKVWETVQPDLATTGDCVAAWKGNHLVIQGKGKVTAASLAATPIK